MQSVEYNGWILEVDREATDAAYAEEPVIVGGVGNASIRATWERAPTNGRGGGSEHGENMSEIVETLLRANGYGG